MRRPFDRHGEPLDLAAGPDSVAVDPATRRELDRVVDDELVDGGEQLPVADVGQEVRLHDRDPMPRQLAAPIA